LEEAVMRWQGRRESSNVEDRRGVSAGKVAGGGIGGIVLLIAIYMLGGDPSQLMNTLEGGGSNTGAPVEQTEQQKELSRFVAVVLAETEDVWTKLFREQGMEYSLPKLVLFSDRVESACGVAGASTGPFYCPGDRKVYIDLAFYDELQKRFDMPGDFAMAYVIAHEVGHHVQTLLGINDKVQSLRSRLGESEYNKYLVRLELQADYFAGVWAHYAERMNLLEEGDLDEALNAASAVGDDRIQKSTQGYVVPDSFTHGTSEQRRSWFSKGFKTGDMNGGDTFGGAL
jgi:uncharacterized protein